MQRRACVDGSVVGGETSTVSNSVTSNKHPQSSVDCRCSTTGDTIALETTYRVKVYPSCAVSE
jgi:hypothetical protein